MSVLLQRSSQRCDTNSMKVLNLANLLRPLQCQVIINMSTENYYTLLDTIGFPFQILS
jgi:hypothetical protein